MNDGCPTAMSEELNQQIARSLDAPLELLPFLAELLGDIWALGSSVEIIVDLLRPLGLGDPTRRVFDVGCGKGAVAVAVAKALGCSVYGVDGFEPFIDEARERATAAGVAELCAFECGDMREAVKQVRDHDVAIYAAHGPMLAGRRCVDALRRCVQSGGYVVVDDGFLIDGVQSKPAGYEECLPYDETMAALTSCGDHVVQEVVLSPEEWHADDEHILGLIRKRAEALAIRHPTAASLLEEYVRGQQRECETLKAIHIPATWLLQRN